MVLTLCSSAFKQDKNSETSFPNIIIILADDMGYGDISSLNENSKIQTPNIDKLANEGFTFTDAHSNSAVCTPTRYGLLTGGWSYPQPKKAKELNLYPAQLYDLEKDIAEENNLAKENPEIVERMKILLQKYIDEGRNNKNPLTL